MLNVDQTVFLAAVVLTGLALGALAVGLMAFFRVRGISRRFAWAVGKDGDGVDTVGYYDQGSATWHLADANGAATGETVFAWGPSQEHPLVGDGDGDGIDTVGHYEQGSATWHLADANGAATGESAFSWGGSQVHLLVGDWDGL